MINQESEEMYLETIYLLKRKKGCVHAVDVAAELNYSRASVSRAVKLLKDKGYISVDETRGVTLTCGGERRAQAVYEKHEVITRLFISMGADAAVAEKDACRIEHVISEELFKVIKNHVDCGGKILPQSKENI